jgi:hypothetical protein
LATLHGVVFQNPMIPHPPAFPAAANQRLTGHCMTFNTRHVGSSVLLRNGYGGARKIGRSERNDSRFAALRQDRRRPFRNARRDHNRSVERCAADPGLESAIQAADAKVREMVEQILADVDAHKDAAVRELSQKFDNWSPTSFKLAPSEVCSGTGTSQSTQSAATCLAAAIRWSPPRTCRS